MLILTVDRKSASPLYRQIQEGIVERVQRGALGPGERLPPTRVLAQRLGLHRSTVLRAYEELWALGYLESRPGSYSTVRKRPPTRADAAKPPAPLLNWERLATPAARQAGAEAARLGLRRQRGAREGLVDFSRLMADRELAPVADVRRCSRAALLEEGRELLTYGDPAGYRPLRESIARRLRQHGMDLSADEIVITGGAQQAIDLVLRTLVRPGDRIAVETPTYSDALRLFRLHGLRLVEIPMGDGGMDLDVLRRRLARRPPRLLYTIPNFHNPTGITTSQAHREQLLALCEAHRTPILEDGFEEEMKYFGRAVLPIRSMDARGSVIYVGTLSKVFFPGLRIGWVAAPLELGKLIQSIQRTCCLAGDSLAQATAHRFCEGGHYEAHLRRVHRAYRKRMQTMLDALDSELPARLASWTRPLGGYTLWLRVRGMGLSESELESRLLEAGVRVAPGQAFYPTPPAEPCFRLSIASLGEDEIREGCRRIGRSLLTLETTRGRR